METESPFHGRESRQSITLILVFQKRDDGFPYELQLVYSSSGDLDLERESSLSRLTGESLSRLTGESLSRLTGESLSRLAGGEPDLEWRGDLDLLCDLLRALRGEGLLDFDRLWE